MPTIRKEFAGEALGVGGRFHNVISWPDMEAVLERCRGKIANQKFNSTRSYEGGTLHVEVRFDDQCKNGHETLAVTATHYSAGGRVEGCGCMHDAIAEVFPEFKQIIAYHLFSTDEPMHYAANVTYHAGDRDCWGLRKGEESMDPLLMNHYVKFGNSPFEHKVSNNLKAFIDSTIADDGEFIVDKVECKKTKEDKYQYSPHFQFAGMGCKWHECPFKTCAEATQWLDGLTTCVSTWTSRTDKFGEGSERDLNAARRAACWPEATAEQLCSEKPVLEALLAARLPELLNDFQETVEGFGFLYGIPSVPSVV